MISFQMSGTTRQPVQDLSSHRWKWSSGKSSGSSGKWSSGKRSSGTNTASTELKVLLSRWHWHIFCFFTWVWGGGGEGTNYSEGFNVLELPHILIRVFKHNCGFNTRTQLPTRKVQSKEPPSLTLEDCLTFTSLLLHQSCSCCLWSYMYL